MKRDLWGEWVESLPARPGAYWLALCLPRPAVVRAGPKPWRRWPAGLYLYAGQAYGPGGLRARLGRHLRGQGRGPWHIDALRAVALPVAWGWTTWPADLTRPWECRWAQMWLAQSGAFVPQHGFGASDCRHGCPTHGVGFGDLGCPPAPILRPQNRILRPGEHRL